MDAFTLHKMIASMQPAHDPLGPGEVTYALGTDAGPVPLGAYIGQPFTLRFTGVRTCVACGKQVKKFYGQGMCWPCFRSAPQASPCIIRPELCEAHLGKGRNVQWESDHHGQEHLVYLSFTGGIKVGVTRSTQVPVRWIDQGAVMALPIARVPYRQLAGAIEVDLKKHFADRTEWRHMLLLDDRAPGMPLLMEAQRRAADVLDPALNQYLLPVQPVVRLAYPLRHVPPKLVSVQLDKLAEITGKLQGIKGQYLVWADGRVLNVCNHTGYQVEIEPV
jgi:hypothetical protein